MYPYPVKPQQLWGLGAILVTLAIVVVTATLVLPLGDPRSSSADSEKGMLASGSGIQVGCTRANGCPEGVRESDVYDLVMPIPADALAVAEGSTMVFDHGVESGEVFPSCGASSLENNIGYGLNCKWTGDRVEVLANVPPGEYGLRISVSSGAYGNEENTEFYGFHILVEEPGETEE